MRKEVFDKRTGAILFKKTQETKDLERLMIEVENLKRENTDLKKRLTQLENALKKDS